MASRSEDFTFYVDWRRELERLPSLLKEACQESTPLTPPCERLAPWRDCIVTINPGTTGVRGRGQVCPCFGGKFLSVTVRALTQPSTVSADTDLDLSAVYSGYYSGPLREIAAWPGLNRKEKERVFADTEETVSLFPDFQPSAESDSSEAAGLVVVSGRTGSGKSTVVREVLRRYVNRYIRAQKGDMSATARVPHVITYEKPIEEPLAVSPQEAYAAGFDFTPREHGLDAKRLEDVRMDALRQTPTLLFVGETRQPPEWKALLEFAGSGHLAVTTTHAGSVVETMRHLLVAGGARTPAERSEVASRIRMVIHVRQDPVTRRVIPALWYNSRQALNAITAEGLGSVLPHRVTADRSACRGFGRTYFVDHFSNLDPAERLRLRKLALSWDLSGE